MCTSSCENFFQYDHNSRVQMFTIVNVDCHNHIENALGRDRTSSRRSHRTTTTYFTLPDSYQVLIPRCVGQKYTCTETSSMRKSVGLYVNAQWSRGFFFFLSSWTHKYELITRKLRTPLGVTSDGHDRRLVMWVKYICMTRHTDSPTPVLQSTYWPEEDLSLLGSETYSDTHCVHRSTTTTMILVNIFGVWHCVTQCQTPNIFT